jgi:hypothetical protein
VDSESGNVAFLVIRFWSYVTSISIPVCNVWMHRTLDRKRIGLLYCTSVEVSSERVGRASGSRIICISLVNGRPVNTYVMSFHRQCVGKYLLFVTISPLHCWRFILIYLWYVILHAGFVWNIALTWFVISVTCLLRYSTYSSKCRVSSGFVMCVITHGYRSCFLLLRMTLRICRRLFYS